MAETNGAVVILKNGNKELALSDLAEISMRPLRCWNSSRPIIMRFLICGGPAEKEKAEEMKDRLVNRDAI